MANIADINNITHKSKLLDIYKALNLIKREYTFLSYIDNLSRLTGTTAQSNLE